MKIAVWHNLPSGGGKRALYDHVRGLVARGHHVECWSPPTADLEFLHLREFAREHVVPLPATPDRPPSLFHRPFWPVRSMAARIAAMDEHCRRCAAEIEAGGFDVLFANCCMFYRATAVGRLTRLPSVLYLQEPYRWLYEALPTPPWAAPAEGWSVRRPRAWLRDTSLTAARRLQVREEVRNAAAFDRILVNSYFSRESVLRAYGLDAAVCYLGIDTEQFADLGLPRERLVVGVGAFVPEKNIPLVIRAVATIPPPRPRLVWVGNVAGREYVEELQRLADGLGVEFEPRVRVGQDELLDLLNRASVMAYAPRLEPFGLAPVEAAACGLPVVAVAEGGVRETVADGVSGRLVAPDPGAIGAAARELLDDSALARRLGAGGKRLARERWSHESAVDRLESHLVQLARPGAEVPAAHHPA
jgi:glycosyltransferase involved in cell wall biosynthesis